MEAVPHALYVYCASHSLNLAVGSSCKIVSIRNCIGTVSSVITFSRASSQRTKTLIEYINEFKELHKAIYYALKKLEECSNIETSRTAFQLSISINNSVFIIALHVIEKFFSLTLPLSIALQKVNIDLLYCYERVIDVCQIFKEIRENGDDQFKQIFSNSEESMLEEIIEVPRTVGRKTALTIFHLILRNNRFTNHHHAMAKLQSLIPNFLKNTTNIKDLQEVALFYKDILPNYETFDAEIKIWLAKWKNVSDRDRPTTSLTTFSRQSARAAGVKTIRRQKDVNAIAGNYCMIKNYCTLGAPRTCTVISPATTDRLTCTDNKQPVIVIITHVLSVPRY
ncbi:hypothetical protein QTP88_013438 [Uroleucon formosanum]